MATTLTSKGQVTIPKRVRELLGLKPGSAVEFELASSGEIVVRPTGRKRPVKVSRFERLRGRATVRMRTEEILALTRAAG